MSTDEQIRTTLRQTADGAAAPPIDDIGFERRVRRHRHRRRASLAGATAAAAAVVLAVPLAVSQIGSDTSPAPAAASPDPTRPQIWFYTENGPRVLTPDGVIHEVTDPTDTDTFEPGGVAILGRTRDGGAIMAPHAGGLERLQLVQHGDRWQFERIPLSDEAAGTGAASADGRYFATGVHRGDTVIYDLSTNQVFRRLPLSTNVRDYSDRVLWEDRDSYVLGFGSDRVEIPATHHAINTARAEAGGDIVAIGDPRPMTQLYDVSSGTARQIDTIEGHGALSPDGRYYLSPIQKEPGYPWEIQKPLTLWERDGDASQPVTGLDDGAGTVWSIAWLDADTAAVMTGVPDRATLWTCEASTRQCEEIYSFPSTQGNFVSWLIGY
jgi:hypothetical protein